MKGRVALLVAALQLGVVAACTTASSGDQQSVKGSGSSDVATIPAPRQPGSTASERTPSATVDAEVESFSFPNSALPVSIGTSLMDLESRGYHVTVTGNPLSRPDCYGATLDGFEELGLTVSNPDSGTDPLNGTVQLVTYSVAPDQPAARTWRTSVDEGEGGVTIGDGLDQVAAWHGPLELGYDEGDGTVHARGQADRQGHVLAFTFDHGYAITAISYGDPRSAALVPEGCLG